MGRRRGETPDLWSNPAGEVVRNDGYQRSDGEVVDYGLWRIAGFDYSLRGPELVDTGSDHIVCVGAAQTFGRFVSEPYPDLLGRHLGRPVLNLGIAGAGPGLFLATERSLEIVNSGAAVVLQVMSGRSVSNSRLDAGAGSRGYAIAAWWDDFVRNEPRDVVDELVAETRARWVDEMRALLAAIRVPTVLFWFARRDPTYTPGYESAASLFGGFPQLIDSATFASITDAADDVVSLVSDSGIPFRLVSRFDGSPVEVVRPDGIVRSEIAYYPSPEMHVEAATALAAPLAGLLGTS